MKYYQGEDKQDYLRDESRMTGAADRICFPESEADIVSLLQDDPTCPVTISGARTGLTGGCVPQGGLVVSTERLNCLSFGNKVSSPSLPEISEDHPYGSCGIAADAAAASGPDVILEQLQESRENTVTCGPGVVLRRLQESLEGTGYFFAPDPTEPTCTIGGMISCNASGARTYRYGPTRRHILRLRVVLANGDVLDLRRGENLAAGRRFSLRTESGARIEGILPDVPMPLASKHAAGYWIRPDMDMLDLFIGSEGTLGVVTEAELRLTPAPARRWGGLLYFDTEDQALDFVRRVRAEDQAAIGVAGGAASPSIVGIGFASGPADPSAAGAGLSTEAIEFFGTDALALLAREQAAGRIHIDDVLLPKKPCCAVYTEHAGPDTASLTEIYRRIAFHAGASGGSPRRSCAAVSAPGLAGLRAFRHAVPECVNMNIADLRRSVSEATKLAADIAVPDDALPEMFALYRQTLAEAGLDSAIFGHIGNSHLHVNIIPRSAAEYSRGRALPARWARAAAACGGSVSAEHGIGKIKKPLLALQYPQEVLAAMFELKRLFDPALRLNPGNLFDY